MAGKIKLVLIVFGIMVFFMIVFVVSSDAAMLYVGPGETYTTIQSAVDAAIDGDTVIVRDGSFIGGANVNKPLIIQSENGYASTFVSGIFNIRADSVIIKGFNATQINLYSVTNCRIIANRLAWNNSSGINLNNSHNNFLKGNLCLRNDYNGMYLVESDSNTIVNNSFYYNSEYGLKIEASNNNFIYLNNIYDNTIANIYSIDSINTWFIAYIYSYLGTTFEGFLGNYYSDHSHADSDGNGVVDTVYDLPGSEPDDDYPLVLTPGYYLDLTPPEIELIGEPVVWIFQDCGYYIDAGAVGEDSLDGNITSDIVSSDNIDINTVGSYTITYNLSDAAGNCAEEVARTVNVVDPNAGIIHYVGTDKPYTEIQGAVDAADNGDTIIVDADTYVLSSPIVIDKLVWVKSAGSTESTIIQGNNTVRCLELNCPGCIVEGITITGGKAEKGGGVLIKEMGGMLKSCVVTNNNAVVIDETDTGDDAFSYGGGIYMINGIIEESFLNNNTATGIGGKGIDGIDGYGDGDDAYGGWGGEGGNGYAYGGGIYIEKNGLLINCILSRNKSNGEGGAGGDGGDGSGLSGDAGNGGDGGNGYAFGGGIYLAKEGIIQNCTITDNEANGYGGIGGSPGIPVSYYHMGWPGETGFAEAFGGGIYNKNEFPLIRNSIIYFNDTTADPDYYFDPAFSDYYRGSFTYSCMPSDPGGINNIIAEPLFVDFDLEDYHITLVSPCKDSGIQDNAPAIDYDRYPRPSDAGFDMGAFEYNPDPDPDEDGIVYYNDNCPTAYNPNQIDIDDDGAGDLCDNCSNIPNRDQADGDGDNAGDICDSCPTDPDKTEPDVCGCGVADTDTDNDGTPDCNDECVDDPAKTEPGICGCGAADTDTDSDGTLDCNDECVNDPDKTEPGICGCGVADADTDSDGTPDCNDECPDDPNKIEPGECGCGVPEGTCDNDDDSGSGGSGGCFIKVMNGK